VVFNQIELVEFALWVSDIEMILVKPVIDRTVHVHTDCLGVAPSASSA
jgi:hypothetical protein